ncbi:MAG TPA: LptF/LptG family permease [Pyrinomonadaceae bacterium]|nr:LptF/LptG family permease [Pyrinomonadaceae bacterium]
MQKPWRALDRYLVEAALPYVFLALTVLSAILLIQQTAKFAEVLGSSDTPLNLTLQVAANLLPGILVFTLPTSVLVGTSTGFGQLGHDSELTAIRAAGVGTLRIIAPLLFLGALAGALTLFVAFRILPLSSQNLRDIGLRAALYKLESPVEPKSFYTGIPGKVVYVREGDQEKGLWGKIFIQWEEQGGEVRLVTAKTGRLDFSGEQAELVLDEALLTTLPAGGAEAIAKGAHVTIERSSSMRVRDERLNLGRSAITRRMREREPEMDELGWSGLLERAGSSSDPAARREATLAFHRRLTLGLSPVIFAFFGAVLGLKVVRGGRSKGVVLSLASMLVYYLISLAGEQLGRAGAVSPVLGSWLANAVAAAAGLLLLASRSRNYGIVLKVSRPAKQAGASGAAVGARRWHVSPFGLLDKNIFNSLASNFLLAVSALVSIFLIFTLFELIKFIVINRTGAYVVVRYLLYLLPFACVAVTPVGVLLAALITFALMVRRNESVAWWSSGQSVFRLIVPCLFFAVLIGACVWLVQDKLMPEANRRQNGLRGMIKTGGAQTEAQTGRRWVSSADARRVYAYDPSGGEGGLYDDFVVFNFDPEATHLERIYIAPKAETGAGGRLVLRGAEVIDFGGRRATYTHLDEVSLDSVDFQAFNAGLNRPMELDYRSLSAYIRALKERGANVQPLTVALGRRLAEPFLPLVMILVGAPLAFVFGRRGTVVALCVSIGVGLLFLGVMSVAQQVGASGLISPYIAAWSPPILFSGAGIYMLTRSQT